MSYGRVTGFTRGAAVQAPSVSTAVTNASVCNCKAATCRELKVSLTVCTGSIETVIIMVKLWRLAFAFCGQCPLERYIVTMTQFFVEYQC